jgi:hypothetical protein
MKLPVRPLIRPSLNSFGDTVFKFGDLFILIARMTCDFVVLIDFAIKFSSKSSWELSDHNDNIFDKPFIPGCPGGHLTSESKKLFDFLSQSERTSIASQPRAGAAVDCVCAVAAR